MMYSQMSLTMDPTMLIATPTGSGLGEEGNRRTPTGARLFAEESAQVPACHVTHLTTIDK
jgi:hypothetical protein